jgi:beta-galactosidase/beta-glucuronidase
MQHLMTDSFLPRAEYPRPQFVRETWLSLNGRWAFEIDPAGSGRERGLAAADRLSGSIVVPFAPESPLSGVGHVDFMAAVWYRRPFTLPDDWEGKRVLLHVGACDYKTTVYLDGAEVGRHVGGYTPFTVDLTDRLDGRLEGVLTIQAEDDVRGFAQAKGKQSHLHHSFGCDYTRTTGIWQTVWLEAVPRACLASARVIPQLAAGGAMIELRAGGDPLPRGSVVRVVARADGHRVGETVAPASAVSTVFLRVDEVRAWSPDDPFLYDLTFRLESADGRLLDSVSSYMGLRSIEIRGHAVELNGRPVFQRLILDQGFYPDGIYTAPSDAALRADIELSLAMGFNGARLHQKVFEPRFLYWCDRLGYLVWGEGPDWGLDLDKAEGFAGLCQTMTEMVQRDFNHPSIVGWCPLNEHAYPNNREGCRTLYRLVKAIDPTRPVVDASGWQHVETDIYDVHDYDQDPVTFARRYEPLMLDSASGPYENKGVCPDNASYRPEQPYFVSEFGGIWWNPGQVGTEAWGYGDRPRSEEAFLARFEGLCSALLDHPRMFGFCYTQLTDVEQEVNGLYTYDRRPKFDPARIRAIVARPAAIEEAAPHGEQPAGTSVRVGG